MLWPETKVWLGLARLTLIHFRIHHWLFDVKFCACAPKILEVLIPTTPLASLLAHSVVISVPRHVSFCCKQVPWHSSSEIHIVYIATANISAITILPNCSVWSVLFYIPFYCKPSSGGGQNRPRPNQLVHYLLLGSIYSNRAAIYAKWVVKYSNTPVSNLILQN